MHNDDSILPAYTVVVALNDCAVLDYSHLSMLAIRRSRLGGDLPTVWRRPHLSTCTTPPLVPTMPRHQAARDALANERRRRTAGPAYSSYLGTLEQTLRGQGYDVEANSRGVHRWRYLLAQKPNDTRIEVHLQPPEQAGRWLVRLWGAGMRVDGFDLTTAGCVLHTTIRSLDQMSLVKHLIGWLTGYIAVTPTIGVPPPPYRLVAQHDLAAQIRAIDSITIPLAN